ncbi:hypothetical protein ABT121_35660 [Streptomyces sp. NPDC001928]|uniref:hypothetical protein n=1 Tax=Streptomyces sp. NPDC001928 TaxID=3154404 RepID=UPI003321728B
MTDIGTTVLTTVGVLAGSGLTGLFAALSDRRRLRDAAAAQGNERAHEHARWLRERRVETYRELLEVAHDTKVAILALSRSAETTQGGPLRSAVEDAHRRLVTLEGPDEVAVTAKAFEDQLWRMYLAVRNALEDGSAPEDVLRVGQTQGRMASQTEAEFTQFARQVLQAAA